jgi:hypothetical protein
MGLTTEARGQGPSPPDLSSFSLSFSSLFPGLMPRVFGFGEKEKEQEQEQEKE